MGDDHDDSVEPATALERRLAELPARPGVYLMKDRSGEVLYVGKAKSLRSRVRSYFGSGPQDRPLLPYLVAEVADVEILITDNEKEALILENNLIKRHKPRYNVRLKDEKTFLSLRVDRKHAFPRFTLVRRARSDGARYFGPFASARAARHTLKIVYRSFGIRSCSDAVFANRTRPCLYYQIGQCLAPCVDYVDGPTYARALREAELLLGGRDRELLASLRAEMAELAAAERFEEAARVRDKIGSIARTIERQAVETPGSDRDFDVIGCHADEARHHLQWIEVRSGRVVDNRAVVAENPAQEPTPAALTALLLQTYGADRPIPPEIVLPCEIEDAPLVAEVLSDRLGRKVTLSLPSRGLKRRLLEMASANARMAAETRSRRGERDIRLLEATREALGLERLPRRIECFDMSNLQGSSAVGSMVVFQDGEPARERYRRYRIRSVAGPDDYAMMREVLLRRLGKGDPPDLLLVDGGPGQLAIARSVAEELGFDDLDIAGLSKGPGRKPGTETIHLAQREQPLSLAATDPVLQLLIRVRDEAHRTAVRYHRELRTRKDLQSELLDVPGLGPQRARELLRRFGSVAAVAQATASELESIPGIGRRTAERIRAHLHPENGGVSPS